ncbi:MAG TPA: tRNA (adenosine(37)-N6)-threonylcarbamoyltransferase complex ATPase subunit type 1 TsaE [Deltaproteobacteria bacterium]|nr:tRNA (adenosine(37)-N6)-threonylcarbamoyltransferase complex ATPase subunit type 1 TsaE [Deltaproteobacteria bacterium]
MNCPCCYDPHKGNILTKEFISTSPQETLDFGTSIGKALEGGEIILLSGDLGSGKTLLTRGIATGLDIDPTNTVVSPSFTLMNIYKARIDIIHVDLYRLDSDDVYELGIEDFMDREHVIIVEWAGRSKDLFQGDIIGISIEYLDDFSRKIFLRTNIVLPDETTMAS